MLFIGIAVCVLYLIVLSAVGAPQAVYVSSNTANQTTFEHYCSLEYPEFQTVLFVLEVLSDIPDKYNESAQSIDCKSTV